MMAENYMLKETLSYPSLIREVIAPLRAQAQSVLSDEIIRNIDCIYIYGSGDSLNAAVCAAQSFWEYAGVPAYPLNAMQASRYAAPCLDRTRAARTLTICISNSGEAARSVEASMAMHAAGTISMAITAKPNSRVGKAVDYILHAPVPAFEPSPIPVPGIRSFALPVVGLYLFALHMAQARGTMTKDEAAAVEQELQQLPDVIEDAFTRGDAVLREFADLCSKCERMEFFGAGPCRGAADFGVSKVLEAQGYSVLSQDIEEFAHQTFFSVDTHPASVGASGSVEGPVPLAGKGNSVCAAKAGAAGAGHHRRRGRGGGRAGRQIAVPEKERQREPHFAGLCLHHDVSVVRYAAARKRYLYARPRGRVSGRWPADGSRQQG